MSVTIKNKEDSTLMKVIAFFISPFCPRFMTDYVTTIGTTIYAPKGEIQEHTRLHEMVHVADYEKYGILFSLSYLFLLPLGWTMRAYWERRAYAVSLQWVRDNCDLRTLEDYRLKVLNQFIGASYLWMWPSKAKVNAWIDSVLIKDVTIHADCHIGDDTVADGTKEKPFKTFHKAMAFADKTANKYHRTTIFLSPGVFTEPEIPIPEYCSVRGYSPINITEVNK